MSCETSDSSEVSHEVARTQAVKRPHDIVDGMNRPDFSRDLLV